MTHSFHRSSFKFNLCLLNVINWQEVWFNRKIISYRWRRGNKTKLFFGRKKRPDLPPAEKFLINAFPGLLRRRSPRTRIYWLDNAAAANSFVRSWIAFFCQSNFRIRSCWRIIQILQECILRKYKIEIRKQTCCIPGAINSLKLRRCWDSLVIC